MRLSPVASATAVAVYLIGLGISAIPVLAQDSQPRLEEIVVTAERRVSSVQNTASAITAISGEKLANLGVVSPEGLMKVTPGLFATTAGANSVQYYIRGIGNFAANAYAEGAVAFSVDGVYLSRPTTYAGLFFDIERVEVLKGPQGTLYGRNATGGAINVITTRPDLEGGFDGYLRGEAGNEEYFNLNGAVNIPVSDQFALRAAGQVVDRDAYFGDDTGDAGSYSGRLSSLYEPSDRLTLLLIGDYQKVDDNGTGSTIIGPSQWFNGGFVGSDAWDVGATSPEANAVLLESSGFFARGPLGDPAPANKVEVYGITGQLDWVTNLGDLTVLAAYKDSDNKNVNYSPGFLIDIEEKADQTSLEVRLANDTGEGLDWVTGAYYFDENINSDSFFYQDANYPGSSGTENSTRLEPNLDTESWAVFGQATYHLSDRWRLVGGLRYTEEDKKQSGDFTSDPFFSGPAILVFPLQGDENWSKTNWKAALEYDVNDDSMLYLSASTGFKAGGFYAEQQVYGDSFDPEELLAYALGSKNRFMEDRLQVNGELFYWDYKDHQESHLSASPGGYNVFVTENIGKAEMYGLDLDIEFLITANDRITAQMLYNHAEFTEFNYTTFSVGPPLNGCPSSPTNTTPNVWLVNCDGFDAIRAPEWSGTLSYQHLFELGSSNLVLDLRAQYSDDFYTGIDYVAPQLTDSYTWYDASLTWNSADDQYSLGVWGRNLSEEEVPTGGFISPFTDLVYGTVRPPRTYGVSFGLNF